jgi:predicted MFS family arabinose efflux permease
VMLVPTALGLAMCLSLPRVDERTARPFDPLGAALLVMTFGLLVVAVGHGQEERWELLHTAEHVGPLLLVSIGAGVLYILHARREPQPLLPLELFKSLTLTTASITNGLVHMTMLMISFLMPFYLQNVLGYTPFSVALMLLPMGIALNVMAFPGGWLYDKFGSRGPCSVAMAMGVVLLLSYLGLNEHSTIMDILPRLVMSGLVLGLFVTPNVSAMLASVPREHYSLTAGLEQTTRNLGHALGVVVSSGVSAFVLGPSQTAWTQDTYIAVVHGASLIAGVTMAGGLLLALMRDEGAKHVTPAPSPAGAPTAP